MSQDDFWQQRYDSVVPRRLTAETAAIVLDLIAEDAERFKQSLWALVAASDVVVCECDDPGCLAGHGAEHSAGASWRMTHIEDGEHDFVHLCTPCKVSREQKPDANRFRFDEMEDDGEEADEDA